MAQTRGTISATLTGAIALALSITPAASVYGSGLKISPSIQTTFTTINGKDRRNDNSDIEGNVWATSPALALSYEGPRLRFSAQSEYEYIDRDDDLISSLDDATDVDPDSEFSSASASLEYQLIKKSLFISGNYSRSQRIADQRSGAFNDRLLSPSELIDVENLGANLRFVTPNSPYVRINSRASIGKSQTLQAPQFEADSFFNIDSLTRSAQFELASGYRFNHFTWQLQGSTQETERSRYNNLDSTSLSGKVTVPVYQNIGLVFTGDTVEYDLAGNSSLGRGLDYDQWGAGINFTPGNKLSLDIIAYQPSDDDEDAYLGGNLNWALSSRSKVEYSRSRNALGSTNNLSAELNGRLFRIRAGINEGIQLNNRVVSTIRELGTFVCNIGNIDLADCFQPDTLNFELSADEVLVSFSDRQQEISEELIDSSTQFVSLSYDNQRKFKASLNYSETEQRGLEDSQRDQDRDSTSLNLSYKLSGRSTLALSGAVSDIDYLRFDESAKNKLAKLTYTNQLSRYLSLTVGASHRDRVSERRSLDIEDNRISLSVQYKID